MSPLSLGVPILWKVSEGFELWPLSWPGPGHSEAGPIHHRHLLLYLERGECVREREEGRIPPSHRPTSERERECVWCVCLSGCTSLGGRGVRTEKTDTTHSLTATGREESLPIGSASNRQKMFRVIFWSSQKVLKCCRVNLLPFISSLHDFQSKSKCQSDDSLTHEASQLLQFQRFSTWARRKRVGDKKKKVDLVFATLSFQLNNERSTESIRNGISSTQRSFRPARVVRWAHV